MMTIFKQYLSKALLGESTERDWERQFGEGNFGGILAMFQNPEALAKEKHDHAQDSGEFLEWWCNKLSLGTLISVTLTAIDCWTAPGNATDVEDFSIAAANYAESVLKKDLENKGFSDQLEILHAISTHGTGENWNKAQLLKGLSCDVSWPASVRNIAAELYTFNIDYEERRLSAFQELIAMTKIEQTIFDAQ